MPIAITAVSATELSDARRAPGRRHHRRRPQHAAELAVRPEAQPTFTLRGVTTQDFSQNQSSPIAMYVDEVYKSVGAVQALQIYDLDRVEVLRGPQGTLYGKNATGGAVSFYSRNPSLTDDDGYVTAGFGNYSDYSVRAAAGGPISTTRSACAPRSLREARRLGAQHRARSVEPLNGVDALAGAPDASLASPPTP